MPSDLTIPALRRPRRKAAGSTAVMVGVAWTLLTGTATAQTAVTTHTATATRPAATASHHAANRQRAQARHHKSGRHHAGRHHSGKVHYTRPSAPKKVHVVKVSNSSFTVTAHARAHSFRLYAATTKRGLSTKTHAISHAKKSPQRSTPTLTLKHLRYSTQPYFYRIKASNGTRVHFSEIAGTVGLEPETPTNLQATSSLGGTSLTWDSRPATGFVITQATDEAMTQNVKDYTTENQDHTFSPYNLEPGTTYYYQISALNGTTASPAGPVVSATARTDEQPVRILSYNIRKATSDGASEGGNRVAPWSQRKAGAVRLIQDGDPDVMAIVEGAALVKTDTRQVDDLKSALGGEYALANTEIPPVLPGTIRTGDYILYKPSVYVAIGQAGHWDLGNQVYAAYQALRNRETGAEFLFVSTHLQVNGQPGGTDQGRTNQDKAMVAKANAYARSMGGLPIVYAGDFNSDPSHGHEFNGPSDYNLSVGLADSFDMAQSRNNEQYNSANGYQTKPPALGLRIDYIFTSPGIATTSWRMLLNLSNGKFAGVIPSDHNPIVANLLLPYQRVS